MTSDQEKIIMGMIEVADELFDYYQLWPGLLFELNRLLEDRHGITLQDAAAGIESTVGHWPRTRHND